MIRDRSYIHHNYKNNRGAVFDRNWLIWIWLPITRANHHNFLFDELYTFINYPRLNLLMTECTLVRKPCKLSICQLIYNGSLFSRRLFAKVCYRTLLSHQLMISSDALEKKDSRRLIKPDSSAPPSLFPNIPSSYRHFRFSFPSSLPPSFLPSFSSSFNTSLLRSSLLPSNPPSIFLSSPFYYPFLQCYPPIRPRYNISNSIQNSMSLQNCCIVNFNNLYCLAFQVKSSQFA